MVCSRFLSPTEKNSCVRGLLFENSFRYIQLICMGEVLREELVNCETFNMKGKKLD